MKKRCLSLSLALLYLFSLLFSVTLIGAKANHEHICKSDCAICRQLQNCSDNLLTPDACPKAEKSSLSFGAARKISTQRRSPQKRKLALTPVSLKDKLIS